MKTNGKIIQWYKCDEMFWFRIFGYGLVIKNLNKSNLLFSERYRLKNVLVIGNYMIKYLDKR